MADIIIIDGVDVSECEYWSAKDSWGRLNACSQRFTRQCECANNPNCHYKQLKRTGQKLQAKEQECETQRYKLNYYIKKTTQLLDDIDNYKQAFDEIENIADDYNRVEKTSQYYRDGFDQIQDIINDIKEQ